MIAAAPGVDAGDGVAVSHLLQSLLAAPSDVEQEQEAQSYASHYINSNTANTPGDKTCTLLATTLSTLKLQQSIKTQALHHELLQSQERLQRRLQQAKEKADNLLLRSSSFVQQHEQLEDRMIDHRQELISSYAARLPATAGTVIGEEGEAEKEETLKERLQRLIQRRKELEAAREWFAIAAKAEELSYTTLRSLQALDSTPVATSTSASSATATASLFEAYIALVNYIAAVHETGPFLAIAQLLRTMASDVHQRIDQVLIKRLSEGLTELHWPAPITQRLKGEELMLLRNTLGHLVRFDRISIDHPLPVPSPPSSSTASPTALLPASPSFLASSASNAQNGERPTQAKRRREFSFIKPFVVPLLLRFRWHFEGGRATNRIDKPEYPLSHILNLLSAHERFISDEVQDVLLSEGLGHVNSLDQFTSSLLPPLRSRLQHHRQQLIALPSVLAHTVYRCLEFDAMLRSRGYPSSTTAVPGGVGHRRALAAAEGAVWTGEEDDVDEEAEGEGEGEGEGGGALAELLLSDPATYTAWFNAERDFFHRSALAAISSSSNSIKHHLSSVVDDDDDRAPHVRVAAYVTAVRTRYEPLPMHYRVPFVAQIQLPLLLLYADRLARTVERFEDSLGGVRGGGAGGAAFGIGLLPGALALAAAGQGEKGGGQKGTEGVEGVVQLVSVLVAAKWIAAKCEEWDEEPYYLSLYSQLTSSTTLASLPQAQRHLLDPLLCSAGTRGGGSLFERARNDFEKIEKRAETASVRLVEKEVGLEMKGYLSSRWDYSSSPSADSPSAFSPLSPNAPAPSLALSTTLNTPLHLFSLLLAPLLSSLPAATATSLYRRISAAVAQNLWERLVVNRVWSEEGGMQAACDFSEGFLRVAAAAAAAASSSSTSSSSSPSTSAGGVKEERPRIRGSARRGWEKYEAAVKILALGSVPNSNGVTFSKVMQVVFDDDSGRAAEGDGKGEGEGEGTAFRKMMDLLEIAEIVSRKDVEAVLRRRPECWR